MLQESVDTADVECRHSSPESENGSTSACKVDIIDEKLATSNACNASPLQSPRNERNVTEMIKCYSNQVRLLRNTNLFKWWDKHAESDFKSSLVLLLLLYQLPKPTLKEFFWV